MQPKGVIKYGGLYMGRIILIKKNKEKILYGIHYENCMVYILRPDRQLCQYFHGGIHFSMKLNLRISIHPEPVIHIYLFTSTTG